MKKINKTACYFPYQTPVRTIILGKYDEGFNTNDNLHQFEIGVTMTGVYENKMDRKVFFKLDTTLLSNVSDVKYLPQAYYTMGTDSMVIIPKGDIKGRILIKLTDAFFDDPKSIAALNFTNYAIPLVITRVEGLDSTLVGKPLVVNPIRNKAVDWTILPKDYTLFGIKYINKFHGNYLRRGADKLINSSDVVVGTKIYHNQYVERDEVVKASTFSLNTISVPNTIRRFNSTDGGTITLNLVFAPNDSCIVYNKSNNAVMGKGALKENGDLWGGKTRDVIYLDYAYTDLVKNEKHEVKDTMVIRDRGVVFETFVPTLK
ncbi:MAG: DUF5627 domain-containing protein [Bacteroidia bacterium]|nr:DUF5627 domain-containing protein [Bacteroidia bacterium]